ncbi:hypothetical protein [Salsipaludibacter albus]|uniref:hypothetical protein n=1 Tax=Salsipaludibacter albus TaxID=2849650 RepID=UPI001EE47B77|nr:hypothetical protein [Salsipaludibacter albus]MBY5164399.1 hypothetical protein [Salsipaludibacter albus]
MTLAVGVALVLAAVNVFVAGMLAWGLSGGDGEPHSPLVGVVALVTMLTAPATAWVVLTRLPPLPRYVLLFGGLALAFGAMAWLSMRDDRSPWPVLAVLGVIGLAVPIVLAATVDDTAPVLWFHVALACGPLLGVLTALLMGVLGIEEVDETPGPAVVLAGCSLVAVPVLLAVLAA